MKRQDQVLEVSAQHDRKFRDSDHSRASKHAGHAGVIERIQKGFADHRTPMLEMDGDASFSWCTRCKMAALCKTQRVVESFNSINHQPPTLH
jgi:hypothetical protein